jgi:hypothetical protein
MGMVNEPPLVLGIFVEDIIGQEARGICCKRGRKRFHWKSGQDGIMSSAALCGNFVP